MVRAFWSALAMTVYVYVVYPMLVLVRGAVRPRPYRSAAIEPSVTVVIAAHNEAVVIAERLENLLTCRYPSDRLEVVIASDGSDDATTTIANRFRDRGVRVLDLPRSGKAAALNAACAGAAGEILVFSDANTVFAPDALRALVAPFADPQVGGVAGDQRYLRDGSGRGSSDGEEQYWNLDRRLKVAQSRAGSVISATGAIYALRRELFEPIPSGVTDDFFASTAVIDRGYRLVFEPHAVAYEPVASSAAREFDRKVRVITQGFRSVAARRALLDPRRTGFYALQLLSHKLLRRLAVLPLLVLGAAAMALRTRSRLYALAAAAQLAWYGAALVGTGWSRTERHLPRLLAAPMYFVMVNAACLVAAVNALRGRRIDRWEPQRSAETLVPGPGPRT